DVAVHAPGSECTTRNRCDFQQLYRELEQRKRCDRLSVGRIHKQHFHHLRTRLSGFGRRKHDQLPRDRVKCEYALLLPSASQQWVCYEPQFQRQKCKDESPLRSEGDPERLSQARYRIIRGCVKAMCGCSALISGARSGTPASEDFRSVASGLKRACFCCHGTGGHIRFALKARFKTGDALSIPKKLVSRVN